MLLVSYKIRGLRSAIGRCNTKYGKGSDLNLLSFLLPETVDYTQNFSHVSDHKVHVTCIQNLLALSVYRNVTQYCYCRFKAAPRIGWAVADLSLRRHGSDLRPFCLEFWMENWHWDNFLNGYCWFSRQDHPTNAPDPLVRHWPCVILTKKSVIK